MLCDGALTDLVSLQPTDTEYHIVVKFELVELEPYYWLELYELCY